MKGTTLVVSSNSVGMSPMVALDLAIMNDGASKLGYYQSEHMASLVINDVLTPANGQQGKISMPAEFWLTADGSKTLMQVRSAASDMRSFSAEFVDFVKAQGFAGVVLLTSAFSPLKRERDSNREIPEVFAYVNAHLEAQDFYNKAGIRKYGWWIEKKEGKKAHPELRELGQGGWSERLFKAFAKEALPCAMYMVFCQGGVDFVGGYVMHQFIKQALLNEKPAETGKLGDLKLAERQGLKTGEQVHELIFQSGKMNFPLGWAQILAFF